MEDIQKAVKTVLNSYAKFEGRSGRSEYWWWTLAYFIGYIALYVVGGIVSAGELLAGLFALALLIPNIAVSVRRFHDIGKSGWWVLIGLIPFARLNCSDLLLCAAINRAKRTWRRSTTFSRLIYGFL